MNLATNLHFLKWRKQPQQDFRHRSANRFVEKTRYITSQTQFASKTNAAIYDAQEAIRLAARAAGRPQLLAETTSSRK